MWHGLLTTIHKYRRHQALRQMVKFGCIGVANTFLDFGVYIGLTRNSLFWWHHLVAANAVSFTLAAASSFVANTFWTFSAGHSGWHRRFPKFFAVALGGMLLSSFLMWGGKKMGIFDLLVKLVATVLVMAWNFTLQKIWTFKKT